MCFSHLQVHKTASRNEVPLADISPPIQGQPVPTGRMDLTVRDSDFSSILADVTITHPFPSSNQSISAGMTLPGHFAQYREQNKNRKYLHRASAIGAMFSLLVLVTSGTMGASFNYMMQKMARSSFQNALNTDPSTEEFLKSRMLTLWRCRICSVLKGLLLVCCYQKQTVFCRQALG